MARFHGRVGYGEAVEDPPGVFTERIVEFTYFGDVTRNMRNLHEGDKVNPDLSVSNTISIVADPYAREHFFAIRYVEFAGVLWTVRTVDASQHPRLLLQLGEVYNGPTVAAP